jgi:hypothetical protein
VALLLGWGIVYMGLSTLAKQRGHQRAMTSSAEWLATRRVARHLLGWEARASDGRRRWTVSADSAALRAYRGHALICPGGLPSADVLVSVRGVRRADPGKDSVLLMGHGGGPRAVALVSRTVVEVPCPGALVPATERWKLSADVPPGTVVGRYFERGAYHLSGRALRYRRGAGGRQPLTPEALASPSSAFTPRPGGIGALLEERALAPSAADTLLLLLPQRGRLHP